MDQRLILQEIAALLEIILEETETISGYQGKIPQIELDMVMLNLQKLYQAYHELNKANAKEGGRPWVSPGTIDNPVERPIEEEKPSAAPGKSPFVPPDAPPPPMVEPPQAPKEVDLPINPAIERPEPEPEVEVPRYSIPQRPADLPKQEHGRAPVPPSSKELPNTGNTLADKLKTNQVSLHEKLESNNGSTLAEKLQMNRISDLKAALGLNERFLFINELFKGDLASFDEAISNLNSFSAYPEAAVFLNHLADRFAWDQEGQAFTTLVSILKRRYL